MRWIIVLIILLQTIYAFLLDNLKNKQRKKPLPQEVADIYDKERYQSFLHYEKDYDRMRLWKRVCLIGVDFLYLFSPILSYIDYHFSNVYMRSLLTLFIFILIKRVIEVIFDYYATFKIEEKYNKNRKTLSIFLKDVIIETLLDCLLTFVLYIPCLYILEHIVSWTHHFSFSYFDSFMMVLGFLILALILYLVLLGISYFYLRTQYTFTELEDSELRHKIEKLMENCPKKVKHIKVYNESKKSTGKNAFLLKILGYREFGIADNFLDDNSERELLAVLSHEIGHLKHKKNIFNYIKYFLLLIFIIFLIYFIPHGEICLTISQKILNSFHLSHMNYDVILTSLSFCLSPLSYIFSFYMNFVSRREEYEADDNAVKNGYGEDLIQTFKRLSSDELIDVYPADFIEFTSFDHPGMYHRIQHIEKEIFHRKP